jgi:site-specific DNA-cytosine methylase
MKFVDLFAGIGGFSLGLERAGMKCSGHVEKDKFCQHILKRNWPDVPIVGDIKDVKGDEFGTTELVCGGDPCPCRSKARSIWGSSSPDLSGYFLALAGRLRPRWILRENVPASDDVWFTTALEMLGYRTVVIRTNSFSFTAQKRRRDIIVGSTSTDRIRSLEKHHSFKGFGWNDDTVSEKTPACFCLTTHRQRYDSRDNYIYESGKLRLLDSIERIRFAGFPDNWLNGMSCTRIAKMCGNSVTPAVVEKIGRAIIDVERGKR